MGTTQSRVSESDAIRQEIAATRSRMDQTLAALESKLTPKSLLDEAVGFISGKVSSDPAEKVVATGDADPIATPHGVAAIQKVEVDPVTGETLHRETVRRDPTDVPSANRFDDYVGSVRSVVDTVKANPIAAALIAAGAGYAAYQKFADKRSNASSFDDDYEALPVTSPDVGPRVVCDADPQPAAASEGSTEPLIVEPPFEPENRISDRFDPDPISLDGPDGSHGEIISDPDEIREHDHALADRGMSPNFDQRRKSTDGASADQRPPANQTNPIQSPEPMNQSNPSGPQANPIKPQPIGYSLTDTRPIGAAPNEYQRPGSGRTGTSKPSSPPLTYGQDQPHPRLKASPETTASNGDASLTDRAASVAGTVKQSLTDAAQCVSETVTNAGSVLSDTTRSASLRTRATARDTTNTLSRGLMTTKDKSAAAIRRGSEKVNQARNEYPLAVGLGALAVGAVAGLLIPRTKKEDEWMGEQSDQLKTRAKQVATTATTVATTHGKRAVQDAIEVGKSEAEARGLTKQGLLERAQSAAGELVEDVKGAAGSKADREGLTPSDLASNVKAVAESAVAAAKGHVDEAKRELAAEAERVKSDVTQTAESLENQAAAKASDLKATAKAKAGQIQSKAENLRSTAAGVANDIAGSKETKVSIEVEREGQTVADREVVIEDDMKVVDPGYEADREAVKLDDEWTEHQKSAR